MRSIYILIFFALTLAISCYKDRGNYNYEPQEKVTISGIESLYKRQAYEERLVINPQVSSTDPDADFDYFWGVSLVENGAVKGSVDTIAKTRDLDYLVALPAGSWRLVCGARNKRTGVGEIVQSNLVTTTRFTQGWYVLKSDEAGTDLDLFLTPTSIIPESKIENVFSEVNNRKLKGNAGSMIFLTSYQTDAVKPGVSAKTRSLLILSEKDISAVYLNTFKEIWNADNIFYERPPVIRPAAVTYGASDSQFLINDGRMHSIFGTYTNYGLFGVPQMRNSSNSDYHLSKYHLSTLFNNPVLYDETSCSFVMATGNGQMLNPLAPTATSKLPTENLNKKLLYLGQKAGGFTVRGWAVLQDKDNPSLKILSSLTPNNTLPTITITVDTLSTQSKLYQATNYTLLSDDENLMYFAVGNEVWTRNLANGLEIQQFVVPAEEELVFIKHKKYTGKTTELPYSYNHVIIGSKSNGKYKIRLFNKTSGNLNAAPAFVLEGNGTATDLAFISSGVGESTYQPTF